MHVQKPSSEPKEGESRFMRTLRERKILHLLAVYAGSGFLLIEFAHHILVNHYNFPHQVVDVIIITLSAALLIQVIVRWFQRAAPSRFRLEYFLIGLIVMAAVVLNVRQIRGMFVHGEEAQGQTAHTPRAWQNSIAVLPFQNMSGDEDQEYFSDGLTEELINALANIDELRVVARTSVFAFKGKNMDVRDIGRELNVAAVLEGSVRRGGDQLRITAQLINVADGYHIWSERWDRSPDDVFAIQDEIALAIADKLKLDLLGEERTEVVEHATESRTAMDFFRQARFHANQQTAEGFGRAIELFKKAIAEDPTFALAHAELADTYSVAPASGIMATPVANALAKEHALRALQLDEELEEAQVALGSIKVTEYAWDEALGHFQRAIDLNPNHSRAHQLYGYNLMCLGRMEEAKAAFRTAIDLDPYALYIVRNQGRLFYFDGRYERATEILNEVLDINPDFSFTNMSLALVYLEQGKNTEAMAAIERETAVQKAWVPMLDCITGIILQRMGKGEEARRIFDELTSRSLETYVSRYWMAALSFSVGETGQGFTWLDKAFRDQGFWIRELNVDPLFVAVREDLRFQALITKLGLD
jgi:serine/threonine-protein kinase